MPQSPKTLIRTNYGAHTCNKRTSVGTHKNGPCCVLQPCGFSSRLGLRTAVLRGGGSARWCSPCAGGTGRTWLMAREQKITKSVRWVGYRHGEFLCTPCAGSTSIMGLIAREQIWGVAHDQMLFSGKTDSDWYLCHSFREELLKQ
eukprot:208974-Prorocentrum_minimum.AAC.1